MVGRFAGKEILRNPTCPFCGSPLDRPVEEYDEGVAEMPVGRCSCGAAFACDVTGHNLGTAMIEALVCSCKGDWDRAWELVAGEDYQEEIVKNYDLANHMIVPGGAYEGRNIAGALYFIRLSSGTRGYSERSRSVVQEEPFRPEARHTSYSKPGKRLVKGEVEALVKAFDFEVLLDAALEDARMLRHIKRLLYSADPLTRYRAADALGKVCARLVPIDPRPISKLLQGLFTSVSDTAASSWGAIDAIGEIMAGSPGQFDSYLRRLYLFLRDRDLLVETLRALGYVGETRPELLRKDAIHFIPLLRDQDAAVRGYTAILLGNLGASEAAEGLKRLQQDGEMIEIYRNGSMETKTVGMLASEALEKLS
ncbi:MAG: PBS lyase [Deltaproteobacteria bacterium]|nr:PBS lyase [Deltaproteobacteria bacterium]